VKYREEKRILARLYEEESLFKVLIATGIGLIPAIYLVSIFLSGAILPIYLFLIPGFTVGYAVKRLGKPVTMRYRVLPALILLVFMIISALALPVYFTYYALAVINSVVVIRLSRRKLTEEEENALWLHRTEEITR
jgi:hypothetical protein